MTKIIVIIIPIIAALSFFIFYGSLIDVSDFIFYKLRENRLNEFVIEIKKYGKIKEMSDGRRYWNTLNNFAVEPKISDVDTTDPNLRKKYFLRDILTREQISAEKYEDFRSRLIDADLISFSVSETGAIYFTIDGFLDSRTGVAYNESQGRPKYNDFGAINRWIRVGKDWYAYYN